MANVVLHIFSHTHKKNMAKKFYKHKWREKGNYHFQLLQEHLFFLNQYICSHTHWCTKKTDGADQSNSWGQQDFSADWDAWKGRFYVRAADEDGSQARQEIDHVWHVFFLLISCLESQPLSPKTRGPVSLRWMCTDHGNTSCLHTWQPPHPGPLPDTLLASLLAHCTAQQQGPCGLPRWQIRPPDSQGIFYVCQCHSKTSHGIPLMVQQLGLSAFTAVAQVQVPVGELRSHKPHSVATPSKKNRAPQLFQFSQNLELLYQQTSSTSSTQILVTSQSFASKGQKRDRNYPSSQTNSYFSPQT